MAYEIDDMEHQVRKIIAQNREMAGFPQLDHYGVSEDDICQHTNANVRRVFAL